MIFKKLNSKAVSEVISQVIIMLIITIIVGIIISAILPSTSNYNSKLRFEQSQNTIVKIDNTIKEIITSPIGANKEIIISLDKQSLEVNSDNNTVIISQQISGDYFKDNYTQIIDETKYNYRESSTLYCTLNYNNINISKNLNIDNRDNITIVVTKNNNNKITIDFEKNNNIDKWYSSTYTNNEFSYLSLSSNNDWNYRKTIIIDHNKIDGNLNNFPILINIESDSDLINYSKENGSDIIFTTENNIKLKREIEDFNSTSGKLAVWIKVPELNNIENTVLYMYFGNKNYSEINSTNVWDENYIAVWHKNDYNNTTISDSTYNNNIGIKKEINGPIEINGKIGKAQNYDGINDYIIVGENENLGLNDELSIFTWVYVPESIPDGTRIGNIIGKYPTIPHFNIEGYTYGKFRIYWNQGELNFYSSGFDMRGAWHYLGFTRDLNTNKTKMYIDGIFHTSASAGTNINIIWPLKIGDDFRNGTNPAIPFHGIIDELRISNIARSQEWIKTQYNNQNDPNKFYNIGNLESK